MSLPNYTLPNADIFFDQTLYAEDWNIYSDSEKTAALNTAITAVEQNMGREISVVASRYDAQKFLRFLFVQALFMIQNIERYRNTSGPLAIMNLAENNRAEETKFSTKIPASYLYPEALLYLNINHQGVVQGRG